MTYHFTLYTHVDQGIISESKPFCTYIKLLLRIIYIHSTKDNKLTYVRIYVHRGIH